MTQVRGRTAFAAALLGIGLLAGASIAQAMDASGSYEGSLGKARTSADVAAVLSQSGKAVSGTIAVESADSALNGVYTVTGKASGKAVKFTGSNGSVTLKWAGRGKGDVLKGKAKWTGGTKGSLDLVKHAGGPPSQPRESCENPFFTGQVMGRVLKPVCANCHVAGGAAKDTAFRVNPDDALATEQSVNALIDVSNPSESRLLKKPTNEMPHGGGQQLASNSDEYKLLQQWADLVALNKQCTGGPTTTVALVPMKANELLVRASMDTRGVRPSLAELDQIEANPAAYDAMVDQYLHSPEFLDRVKDAYDDALLVRREDFSDEARDKTSAIYGEALELLAYIVKNDRPFTEMGTADYTVANSLFQSDTGRMPYPMEPVTGMEWQPTHYTDGRPHAGVLSTSAFYEVWDTNDTNKNRRRANRISILFHCYNFLDTPVDVTRNVDNNDQNAVLNAVTQRSDCKACHDRLDPMASFLFKMDNAGLEDQSATDFYRGDAERWRRANKRPPAVYGTPGSSLQDMGRLLVQHPKFAECQTKRAFKMLFLRDPQTNDELAAAADIASHWSTDDGYNFRSLVKRWMTSGVYKGRPTNDDPAWVRRTSPERLELLVSDLTGFVWNRPAQNDQDDADPNSDPPRTAPVPLLTTEENGYRIILGSINGVSVSARSFSLNASVAMVQRKLASLAADWVVAHDLVVPDDQRKLLVGVTGTDDPSKDEAAIRNAIVKLGRRMYGESWSTDAPAVDVWFDLYSNLYADQSQTGTGTQQVPGARGERAWRGLLIGMLRSPRLILY